MMKDDLPLVLRVEEVATILQIGKNSAYDLVHTSDFPAIRVGHRILIPREQLFTWIESHFTPDTKRS